ncbi:MAG: Spermine synthase [Gemmataceae bacterium]|nr:Spermine synthase [Gemmataceae bacterium]
MRDRPAPDLFLVSWLTRFLELTCIRWFPSHATKAVVHMAILFGGRWTVNPVVVAAILVMSLAGWLYAAGLRPKQLEPYCAGPFAIVVLGLVISLNAFLGRPPAAQMIGACVLVFAPIAFTGVVFAVSFGPSTRPYLIFAANIAGATVGGLAENVSILLGFQYLLCVAAGFYLLSSTFGNRTLPAIRAEQSV